VRLSGLVLVSCAVATAIACSGETVGPDQEPGGQQANLPWHDDGIFRYCRMYPSLNGSATMFMDNGWTGRCIVQPHPTPQAAYFGSSNTGPVTFNFDGTVRDIRVEVDCTGCPTDMRAILYDSAGAILDQDYLVVGPGDAAYQSPPLPRGCKKMVVTAPTQLPPDTWPGGVWAFLHMEYNPICRWTGDSVLEDEAIREALRDALAASNPYTTDPSQRKEHGGIIWRLQDGSLYAQPIIDPFATACTYKASNGTFTPPPGAAPVAGYHVHPNFPNHYVDHASCPSQVPPGGIGYGDPDLNGGAGNNDWDVATAQGFPTYVISPTGTVSRLDPNTPKNARPSNKNRWRWDPNESVFNCFTKMFA
jgi:hypothetical protein